ncbi:hypothetical protein PRK78_004154 [Emydomyces testavorans]|uniref:Uncharacterized protein n=1 Tax=Emydomyces testavorans TaxID=2070801 RepID=A0AAF0DJP6_9EURO|nr:hypothetical protein PRK78_004154 [Emydomyces testavorans]
MVLVKGMCAASGGSYTAKRIQWFSNRLSDYLKEQQPKGEGGGDRQAAKELVVGKSDDARGDKRRHSDQERQCIQGPLSTPVTETTTKNRTVRWSIQGDAKEGEDDEDEEEAARMAHGQAMLGFEVAGGLADDSTRIRRRSLKAAWCSRTSQLMRFAAIERQIHAALTPAVT